MLSDEQVRVALGTVLKDLEGSMYAVQVEAVEAAIEGYGVCKCGVPHWDGFRWVAPVRVPKNPRTLVDHRPIPGEPKFCPYCRRRLEVPHEADE